MTQKLKRILNLMWSIPLLVILIAVGMLLSVTVEKRQLRQDTTPRETDGGAGD